MKLIVAGHRSYFNYDFVKRELDHIIAEEGWNIDTIIQGSAIGVDTLARQYANEKGYTDMTVDADWNTHGRKAGPIRNAEMVQLGDALVAFWDGESRGTSNMIYQANKKELPILIVSIQ